MRWRGLLETKYYVTWTHDISEASFSGTSQGKVKFKLEMCWLVVFCWIKHDWPRNPSKTDWVVFSCLSCFFFFQFLIFPLWKQCLKFQHSKLKNRWNLWKELKGVCVYNLWIEFAECLQDVFRNSNFNLLYRYVWNSLHTVNSLKVFTF